MMLICKRIYISILIFLISCNTVSKYNDISNELLVDSIPLSMKLRDIKIGLGVHGFNLLDTVSKKIPFYFNSLSTANAMKFEAIHPHIDEYNWNESDSIINFALSNKMFVRGHTLLWGKRNPYWLSWDAKGNLINRKLLDKRLKEHILTVVRRYKGKVYAWDVVNEAIYDNDKEFLKPNIWYKIMGADYIKNAFVYAHQADSSALLFYNDYDAENPDKLKRIVNLLRWLKSENIPIHGIGIQAHWKLDVPSISEIRSAINTYHDLGLKVEITEMDIKIPDNFNGTDEDKLKLLSARYYDIFKLFSELREKISGITFWQTSDFPMKYPPIFNEKFQSTPVYNSFINSFLKN